MTFAQAITLINTYIVANANNEITANVLNPVLNAIASFANDTIGDKNTLTTSDKTTIVNAINSLKTDFGNLNNNGVKLVTGYDNPNETSPSSYNYGDFYMELDNSDNPLELWQWNGINWVSYNDTYSKAEIDEILSNYANQDLQSVLDKGHSAVMNNGLSDTALRTSSVYLGSDGMGLTGTAGVGGGYVKSASVQVIDGKLNLNEDIPDGVNTKSTSVQFDDPTANTVIKVPAKTTAGTYTLATTDDITTLSTQLLGGAPDNANTLKELYDYIVSLQAIVGSATPDGDSIVNTLTELLAVFSTYSEGVDLAVLLNGKVNTTDVNNALDSIVAGKVLDARQGKVLNDLISALTTAKQDTFSVDASLQLYDNILASNISNITTSFIWNTGNSKTFTLPFTPTNLIGIYVNGLKLYKPSQFTRVLPNQVEILQTLLNEDVIEFTYEHYNVTPL